MINPKEMLTTLVDRFAVTGKVQNVFGEPIETHGKTLSPVARVNYGLGAGGGGKSVSESEDAMGGGGGGGGVNVTPIGVLEVTDAATRFVRFIDPQMAAGLVAGGVMFGLLLGRLFGKRQVHVQIKRSRAADESPGPASRER